MGKWHGPVSFGFHIRLLVPVLVLISLAVFLVAYISNGMVQGFVQERFRGRIEFLAGYLARNAELGILIDNQQMLQEMAANLLRESDVAGVQIFDDQGRALAEAGSHELRGSFFQVSAPVYGRGFHEQGLELSQAQPEEGTTKERIGRVVIHSHMHGLQVLQHTMQVRFVLVALGVSGTAMILFFLLSRSLVAPIVDLGRTARKVAKGDHSIRAVPGNILETRELAQAFNSMLDSLQWSSQALEEAYQDMMQQRTLAELGRFAMTIAHEVKNPLGIIKSSLDMLKREHGLTSQDMLVGYIEDEIQRLNRLIEDFLLFSKPAKAALIPVEMRAFVLETVQRFEMQFGAQDVQMQVSVPDKEVWILGDKDLLARAMHNLLKNAIEANTYQGIVWVWAHVQENDFTVHIADQGPGIEPEMEEQIFEPFYTSRSQGTGLGLSYVAQVVTVHKGTIKARNTEHGGAEFRIRLPLLENV